MSTKPKTVISEDGRSVLIDSNALLAYILNTADEIEKNCPIVADNGSYKGAFIDEQIAIYLRECLHDEISADFGLDEDPDI